MTACKTTTTGYCIKKKLTDHSMREGRRIVLTTFTICHLLFSFQRDKFPSLVFYSPIWSFLFHSESTKIYETCPFFKWRRPQQQTTSNTHTLFVIPYMMMMMSIGMGLFYLLRVSIVQEESDDPVSIPCLGDQTVSMSSSNRERAERIHVSWCRDWSPPLSATCFPQQAFQRDG